MKLGGFGVENLWMDLLKDVKNGVVTPEDAYKQLRDLPYKEMGYAKVDHHRRLRQGDAEVIFCPGKTSEQITFIFEELISHGGNIIATRASKENYEHVKARIKDVEYYDIANLIVYWHNRKHTRGNIAVVTAGTADQAVAEEAAITAEVLGNNVTRVYDVGVAGIHRLLSNQDILVKAKVAIVVAGMEGALASVVGGLVSCPLIGVPTSVGYGTSFGGVAPLLTMLNSCAAGMAVVNIDNGFGAAMIANRINRLGEENSDKTIR